MHLPALSWRTPERTYFAKEKLLWMSCLVIGMLLRPSLSSFTRRANSENISKYGPIAPYQFSSSLQHRSRGHASSICVIVYLTILRYLISNWVVVTLIAYFVCCFLSFLYHVVCSMSSQDYTVSVIPHRCIVEWISNVYKRNLISVHLRSLLKFC